MPSSSSPTLLPPAPADDVTHIAVTPLIGAAPALLSRPTLTSTTAAAARRPARAAEPRDSDEVPALRYTLFESAKLAGCDPRAYVLEATRRAIASPGAVTLPEDLT